MMGENEHEKNLVIYIFAVIVHILAVFLKFVCDVQWDHKCQRTITSKCAKMGQNGFQMVMNILKIYCAFLYLSISISCYFTA